MGNEFMPLGGAKELRKSTDGRRYLGELQKKHEIDLLQPGSLKFEQVYGEKIRKQEETRQKISKESKEMYAVAEEKKKYEQFREEHVNRRFL